MGDFDKERLQKYLEGIFETSSEGIIIFDANGYIVRSNPAFNRLLVYDEDELKGKLFTEIIHKEERVQKITSQSKLHHFQRSSEIPIEMRLRDKKGNAIPVQLHSILIKDDGGELVEAIGMVKDLRENKKEAIVEKKTWETQENLENVLSNSGDAIVTADANGCITITNAALLAMLNYQEDELLGRHLIELSPYEGSFTTTYGETISITDEYINYQVEKANELFEKGRVTNYELFFIRKDRVLVPVEATLSVLKDQKGERRGSIAICRDITERKRADKKIKEARDFLENIIESSLDGITVSDYMGFITKVNKSFLKLIGYKEEEVIGKHIVEFAPYEKGTYESTTGELVEINDDFISSAMEKTEKLIKEGKISNWENYYLHKNGKIVPVEIEIAYLHNEQGDVIGSVGLNRDTTERKKVEKEIKETKEFLESVIESSKDGIIIADEMGYIISINTALLEMSGYKKEDLIGEHASILSVEDKEMLDRAMEKTAELYEKGFAIYESKVKNIKNGTITDLECITSLINDDKGNTIAGVGIMRDITERKKTEEVLKKSEKQYHNLIEHANDGIIATNGGGIITTFNKKAEDIFGYTREEILGKSVLLLSPEEDRERERKALENFKTTRRLKIIGKTVERFGVRKDGEKVSLEATGSMVETEGDCIITVIIRDITERKRAEKELQDARDFLENIIETIGDGVLICDAKGTILSVNSALEKMYEYRRGELIGQHTSILTTKEDKELREIILEKTAELFAKGTVTYESVFRRKDGRVVEVECNNSLIKDKADNYIAGVSIFRDISYRKRAARELREAKDFLEKVIENSKDGIVITDEKGHILSINTAMEGMSGFKKEEVMGEHASVFSSNDKALRKMIIEKTAEMFEKGFSCYEATQMTKDGNFIDIECIVSLIKNEKEEYIAGVSIIRDITERKKILQQLLQSEKLKSLGELAGGVAHDFNNVLAAILGRVQLLKMRMTPPPGVQEKRKAMLDLHKGLEIIEKAAYDGAETVRRIQEFSRKRADDKDFTQVDINELIKNALEFTRAKWKDEAESKGIKVVVKKELSGIPCTAGSESELREVFINLINNALDAMPQGGHLTIKTFKEDTSVVVTVKDTGTGIPHSVRERIFDPFFTTKGPQSSGLGLSVSYGIINRHRGTISVDSTEDKGTTFTVRLPIAKVAVKETKVDYTPTTKRRGKILVIDDEEGIRNVLNEILTDAGHEVAIAHDGIEGIELFEQKEFDLVLTDLGMPVMSGWQVAEKIKSISRRVPVAIITGWSIELQESEMKTNAIDLIIKKPFAVNQVLRLVQEAMELRDRFNAA